MSEFKGLLSLLFFFFCIFRNSIAKALYKHKSTVYSLLREKKLYICVKHIHIHVTYFEKHKSFDKK